jgi:hypothetical protein
LYLQTKIASFKRKSFKQIGEIFVSATQTPSFFFLHARVIMDLQKSTREDSNAETQFRHRAIEKSATLAGACKGTEKKWTEPS